MKEVVFKVTGNSSDEADHVLEVGDIVALVFDDGSSAKRYECIKGSQVGSLQWIASQDLVAITRAAAAMVKE